MFVPRFGTAACLVAVAIFGEAVTESRAEDWPTFAHDRHRSNVTSDEVSPPLHLQWVFRSPSPPAPGWSPPVNGYGSRKNKSDVSYDDAFRVIAVDGRAFFCSSAENRVVAIDAASGRIAWTFTTTAAPRLAPTHVGERLYLGDDSGTVWCLRAASGDVVWTLESALTEEQMLGYGRFSSVWPIRTGVLVDDGVGYFVCGLFAGEGLFFHAFDPIDGSILWRRQIDRNGAVSPSPQGDLLATDDSIFMTSRTPPTRWSKVDGRRIPFATPRPEVRRNHEYRYHDGGSYAQIWNGRHIVYGQACLLGYDPDRAWKDRYGRGQRGGLLFNWFNARQAVLADGVAYVATDYHVLAVDAARLPELSRTECYEFEKLYKDLGVATRLDLMDRHSRLVREFGADHPRVRALERGPLKWSQAKWDRWPTASRAVFEKFARRCRWMTPLAATEAMIRTAEVLYLGGEDRVVAVDAASGAVLWNDVTGSRVRGLAAADGRLYVSTIDGAVRCYAAREIDRPVIVSRSSSTAVAAPSTRTDTTRRASDDAVERCVGGRRGYWLVIGAGDGGRAAREIARRTRLQVEVLDSDITRVAAARAALAAAGLYGARVRVLRDAGLESLPYPPYAFNVVVDTSGLLDAESAVPPAEIERVLRPYGGVALVASRTATDDVSWRRIERGELYGAANWTHNYADAANTYANGDRLVKGPFGVLWYGEPGPRKRVDRHRAAPIPLVVDGVLYTVGNDLVMAYDVYNGVRYWERALPGVTRTGLPLGTSNLVADESGLFAVVGDRVCHRLDRATGRTLREYRPPPAEGDTADAYWGWIALVDGVLYGSRPLVDERRRRADPKLSAGLFAIDVESGRTLWRRAIGRVEHDGIAIGAGKVFFVDAVLDEAERERAANAIPRDASVPDRPRRDARGQPLPLDLRKLVALDARSGASVWEVPFDATDITLDDRIVQSGRVAVACMVADGVVVAHGTGSLGHPHREFLAGEFARRAIHAFRAADGAWIWGGRKNYRKRPIIVGDTIWAEPFAWNLKTGAPKMVRNPLSGRLQRLDIHRGYIGCSHLLGSGVALFGNCAGIGYRNLDSRAGFASFSNVSLGCGLVAAPACGVFVAPEGRAGCTCRDQSIRTSIVLYPRERVRAWSFGAAGGLAPVESFPVRHAYINLGARGYREDDRGRLWLPYPGTGRDGVVGKWLPTYRHDASMFYSQPPEHLPIASAELPWLYASGYRGTKELAFRLVEKDAEPRRYDVTLHFAEPDDLVAGQRTFSIAVQGTTVLRNFDIVREAGGTRRAITRTFRGVEVAGEIRIGFNASASSREPVLCAVEIVAADGRASTEDGDASRVGGKE